MSFNPEQLYRELDEMRHDLRDGFGGINKRLDILNSRTRKLEIKQAVIWFILCILGSICTLLLPRVFEVLFAAVP